MRIKLTQHWRFYSTWLRFLIIVLLLLGVFFRFVNLDRKVYWFDETYTSLRISGYTQAEAVQQLFDGHAITIEDLHKYQRTNPEKGLIDTVKSLAVEEAQHPPLYFVMVRFWVQWFGNSVAVRRSLSALISLLVFPCIYWLCRELFSSSLVGWIAVTLIAVSPFHVLYAQEAREYSLWTVTILLSSASLLQAMRLKTKLSWGIYAVTVALGLYAFPFHGFVVVGHGIYVVVTERFRLSKAVTAYLFASLAGLLTFVPWLLVMMSNVVEVQASTAYLSEKRDLVFLIKKLAINTSRVFFDFNHSYGGLSKYLNIPIILILVGYLLYFLYRRTPKKIWLFILTLIGTTALALILPDLILGGGRSTQARYLIPCYLGIQIAVAYLLATQITSISVNSQRQKLWQLVIIMLVSAGVLSCAVSSQAQAWWNKGLESKNPQVAHIINQATQPLLISNSTRRGTGIGYVMSLSYLLEPKVRLQLVVEPKIPKIPDGFSDVFLFDPFKDVLQYGSFLKYGLEKEQDYKIKTAYKFGQYRLWRLEKK